MKIKPRNIYIIVVSTMASILLCLVVFWWRLPIAEDGLLHVYFLDIGQGDAIYIKSPGGKDMLVDGGPSDIVLQRLGHVMSLGDKIINYVVETHPDADHIGGLPSVLSKYKVGEFIEPGIESNNSIDDRIRTIRSEKGIPDVLARRGASFDLGGGVRFDILFPDKDVSHFKDTNEASIVGQVVYGSTTVMLTGDSPKKIENYLLSLDASGLKSDVLKVGHHGSRNSSGETYIAAVDPTYAVISAGRGNRYGHPHEEVLNILSSQGAIVLRTDEKGTIEFKSDGKKIMPVK